MKKFKLTNKRKFSVPLLVKSIDGGSNRSFVLPKEGSIEIFESQLSTDVRSKVTNKLLSLVEVIEPSKPVEESPVEKVVEKPVEREVKKVTVENLPTQPKRYQKKIKLSGE